jgi:NhaA family Na+:H+ antiporter
MITDKIIDQLSSPFSRFTNTEAISGLLLIIFSSIALIWANSGFGESYEALWHTHFKLGVGDFLIDKPLHIWINDGLMALFFFYVGLEIKQEVMVGELSDLRQASLPFFAALGGMIVPAGLFFLFMYGQEGIEGWGIPMATDIAFSLGILMLLGKRVPNSMKVFLTAFAIVDDIGAVLVIAIFYSTDISWNMLYLAAGVLGLLVVLKQFNLRNATVYFLFGAVIWYLVLRSGVHPTVAGIAVALIIPTNNRIRMRTFAAETRSAISEFMDNKANAVKQFLAKPQLRAITDMEDYIDMVQPPLQKLEHHLHPYVSFGIMPLFALANAGVVLHGGASAFFTPLSISIALGLVLGKVIGIVFFSWLSVQLKVATLPQGTRWVHLTGLGFLGGIGFTMALFISNLAFKGDADLINPAKLGILMGSTLAGIIGFTLLYWTLPRK